MKIKIKIGDRITFCALEQWNSDKYTRTVNGFFRGLPTVRFEEQERFVVREQEIIKVGKMAYSMEKENEMQI